MVLRAASAVGLSRIVGELGVRAVHFHARDDRFALVWTQPRQRRAVAVEGFAPDGVLERRAGSCEVDVVEVDEDRCPALAPQFVAQRD